MSIRSIGVDMKIVFILFLALSFILGILLSVISAPVAASLATLAALMLISIPGLVITLRKGKSGNSARVRTRGAILIVGISGLAVQAIAGYVYDLPLWSTLLLLGTLAVALVAFFILFDLGHAKRE